MSAPFRFAGRTAAITGAASGIGAALAADLAGRGVHLALADIDAAGLAAVAGRLERPGLRVTATPLDIADADAIAAFAAEVEQRHGPVHLLFNNAGVALGGTFDRVSAKDFDWLIDINFQGVVRMTRAFLPLLRAAEEARIVNISSIFGIIAPAGQTAYSAAKFAVRGFSKALTHELAGTLVGVTTVHPGGIATAIARNARAPADATAEEIEAKQRFAAQALVMPPAQAARIILRGVERHKRRILVGRDAHAIALIERLFPVGYWQFLGRRLGSE